MRRSHRASSSSARRDRDVVRRIRASGFASRRSMLGTSALAAEGPETEPDRAVSNAVLPDGTRVPDAATTREVAANARPIDHGQRADAKEHKRGTKERKGAPAESESAAALAAADPGMVEQKCAPARITGTHIWRVVCVSPAQQQANDRYDEQQATDYLRRLSELGTLAPAMPSRYIQGGIP